MNEFEFPQLNNNKEEITPEVIAAIAEEEKKPFEINLNDRQRIELQNAIQLALNS
jgi:hypothetical protein